MVDSHHRACAHIRVSCSCQICKTCGLLEGPSAPLSISIQWQLHGPVQKKPIIISTQLVGSDPMQTKSSCPTCRKTLARLLFTVFPLCSRSQISQVYISRLCVYIYVCVCISLSLSLVPFCVWETLKFYTVLMCSNLYGIAYNWNAISDSLLGTNNPFQNDNFALSEPHSISN